jgi:outer membrane receptor protein involved in Fe transport
MTILTPRRSSKWITASGLALAAGLACAPAFAQTPAPAAPETEGTEVEEVVVTAQKREESLQDVPIAVSAFTAETLDRVQIENAQDIQFSVPNAMLVGNERFTLRGIGNNAISSTADNGVQTFVNTAATGYLPQDEFYDLERIEVLRGPQGTLYGRNTTGGAINVVTRRPTDRLEGFVSGQVGNFESVRLQGAVNLPLTGALRQRFAGYVLFRDGFTENLSTGNNIDGRSQHGLRSTTELDLSPMTRATLLVQYYEEDSSRARESKRLCKAIAVLGCSPNETGFDSPNAQATIFQRLLAGPLAGTIFPPGGNIYSGSINPRDLRQVSADTDPTYDGKNVFSILELTHEFGRFDFTSVTSFAESRVEANTDFDNADPGFRFLRPISYLAAADQVVTTDRLITTDSFEARSRTYAQEFRLASDFDGMFDFTVGAFYLDTKGRARFRVFHPAIELFSRLLGLPPVSYASDNETPYSRTRAAAVFGEGYFQLSPDTKVTIGGRYTKEEKDIRTRNVTLSAPGPYIVAGVEDDRFTGKITVDHDLDLGFTQDTLLYGSVSTGYKGGGLNPGNTVASGFRPETVTAYEVGAKNTLMNRSLQANLAAFYYDYTDLQLGQRIAGNVRTSNADAVIYGAEAELVWSPTDRLLFDSNLSYLHTEIGDFQTVDPANPAQSLTATTPTVPVNLNGNRLPFSPSFKIKVGGQYSMPLGTSGWTGVLRADVAYQDEYFSREFNTPNDRIDGWTVVDLQARAENAAGDLQLQFFMKNATDEDNITNSIVEDALVGSYRNARILEPRIYGVALTKRF